MRMTAWLSTVWKSLKDLDTDDNPVERLEARVATLERAMTSALTARSPDILTPPDQPSEAASPSGRI